VNRISVRPAEQMGTCRRQCQRRSLWTRR
jgi:hypothetical protein